MCVCVCVCVCGGGGGGSIYRRWLISGKTLSLSVTRTTKHLKSLELSCEAAAEQLNRSDVTSCDRSLAEPPRGIWGCEQPSHAPSPLH